LRLASDPQCCRRQFGARAALTPFPAKASQASPVSSDNAAYFVIDGADVGKSLDLLADQFELSALIGSVMVARGPSLLAAFDGAAAVGAALCLGASLSAFLLLSRQS
jgi:hypothetical protein